MDSSIEKNLNYNQEQFPKIFTSKSQQKGVVFLQQCFIQSSKKILEEINKSGAILFRDFDIKSPNQVLSILKQLGLKNHPYQQVSPIRNVIVGRQNKSKENELNKDSLVMLSTQQACQNQVIPFHNQLLQTQNYPTFRTLYCEQPAIKGGQTSLLNTKQIYKFIQQKHKDFLKKLQQNKIRYIRTISQKSDIKTHENQRGWKQIFHNSTKQQVQKKLKNKYDIQWLNNQNNDCILKSKQLQAIIKSQNGQKMFVNQILNFYKKIKQNQNSDHKLTYGNGEELPKDILQNIYNHAQQIKVKFNWKKGDLMIIDNLQIMTTREPYQGPFRKVHTCLMKGSSQRQKRISLILNNGDQMPLKGFGTWKLKKQKCQQNIYKAITNGYRMIDCAAVYGNQIQIGKGIKKAIQQKIVTRQQLFIVSKLWNTFHRPENVKVGFMKTLKDLDLQYLDLYLMHFPVSLAFVPIQQRYPAQWIHDPNSSEPYILQDPVPNIETWKSMQSLVQQGLVRSIGISNFNVGLLRQLIFSSRIKPSVLQIQLHPELTQKNLIRFARQKGIQITSYSTFGASSYISIGIASENQPIYNNSLIQELSKKYNKSTHQLILRWAIQQGYSIIPKSSKQERMKQNWNIEDFRIEFEDMKKIDSLNQNKMYNDPANFSEKQWGTFYPIHD